MGRRKGDGVSTRTRKSAKSNENKQSERGVFEVESLLDVKTERSGRLYLVRWKGFGTSEDTWEPEENLSQAKEMVEELEAKRRKPRAVEKRTRASSRSRSRGRSRSRSRGKPRPSDIKRDTTPPLPPELLKAHLSTSETFKLTRRKIAKEEGEGKEAKEEAEQPPMRVTRSASKMSNGLGKETFQPSLPSPAFQVVPRALDTPPATARRLPRKFLLVAVCLLLCALLLFSAVAYCRPISDAVRPIWNKLERRARDVFSRRS